MMCGEMTGFLENQRRCLYRQVARQFGLSASTVGGTNQRYLERRAKNRKKPALRQMSAVRKGALLFVPEGHALLSEFDPLHPRFKQTSVTQARREGR
jgi:hypothetical protein